MEMTLNNLMSAQTIDHQDFLDRVDLLGALGKTVMISNYTRFEQRHRRICENPRKELNRHGDGRADL